MTEKKEMLFKTIRTGDFKTFKSLINENKELVNVIDKNGLPPLHCAIFCDDFEMVKFLTNSGANIDAKNINGETALDYARSEKMKELLLVDAVRFNNFKTVKKLIDEDPKRVDTRCDYGMLIFYYAVEGRRFKIARFLFNRGADVEAEYITGRGQTTLQVLLRSNSTRQANFLKKLINTKQITIF